MKSKQCIQATVVIGALYMSTGTAVLAADDNAAVQPSGPLQEVTVTATRREESLSKVPISVTAISKESLDQLGIKDFQDAARFTPGVKIDQGGNNNISIRGISGSGGAGTTGIYIDDTPIQIRGISGTSTDTLPKAFDIDRIEILRGPQGTLFGAGSEGGTVRYITTQPSTTKASTYARGEFSYTQGGQPSYEAGVAGNVPVIDGTLGVRATAWYRRDGGWLDRLDPTSFQTVDSNANRTGSRMARLSAIWAVNDVLQVQPGIAYQRIVTNNNSLYFPIVSDPGKDRYASLDPDSSKADDRFYLPSLKVTADFGPVTLISNTSYYDRRITHSTYAATIYDLGFYQTFMGSFDADGNFLPPFPLIDGSGIHLPPGLTNYRSPVAQLDTQRNLTQEIRLQSSDPSARFIWTTGLFYTYNRQEYLEQILDPDLENFTEQIAGGTIEDVFGVGWGPNQTSWYVSTKSRDKQKAWYGEGTFNISEQWKVTAGARYSDTSFAFDLYNSGAQLFGPDVTASPTQKQGSFTPKLNVSYQVDNNNLYYFTYAKGFRPGGGNTPIPTAACGTDFPDFGITEAPLTYDSDTTQSYEIGSKNSFQGRFRVAGSLYYIKWDDIQQQVYMPTCGLGFISNLGTAVAKGGDIQAQLSLTDAFSLEVAAGYTDARYTKDSKLSAIEASPVTAKGNAIEGPDGEPAASFTASIGAEYRFTVADHETYVRGDYEFQDKPKWNGPSEDPNTLQYNPSAFLIPSSSFASLRGGVRLGGWDVSAFVDNLTDAHPLRGNNFSVDAGNGASRLQWIQTYRPRTFGVTATFRQ